MNRRMFCAKTIATVAAGIGLGVTGVAAGERPLRKVYRILVDGKRERVRMYQLKIGDVVEVENVSGQWKTTGTPCFNASDGCWMVDAVSYATVK